MRIGWSHGQGQIEGVGDVCVSDSVVGLLHGVERDGLECVVGGVDGPGKILVIAGIEGNFGGDGLIDHKVRVGQ